MYCFKCGKEISDGINYCSYCGQLIDNKKDDNKNIVSKRVEGKGSSIASMVLGIIAIFFAVSLFLSSGILNSVFDIAEDIDYHNGYNYQYQYDLDDYYELADYTIKGSFIISSIVFVLPLSITGLCLGISSKKKIINGFNKAGVILNSITLIVFVLNFIIIMFS